MNGAYFTNLHNFISERDIALWFHGHTHFTTNYMIDHTLVLTNQRGYIGQEAMANNFELKEVELEEV